MPSNRHALFGYPLHSEDEEDDRLWRSVPLDGVPQIPDCVARKISRDYEEQLTAADIDAANAAIAAAMREISHRHMRRKVGQVHAGHRYQGPKGEED